MRAIVVRATVLYTSATWENNCGRPLAPYPSSMPRRLRILVADDNRDSADTLGILLRESGYTVCVAHGGDHAVHAAGAFGPDVAILDLAMPQMDGFKTAEELRRSFSGAVYVAYTGLTSSDLRAKCETAGFKYLLRKPAELDEIESILRMVATDRYRSSA